jgi:hypothetical protein
MPTNLAAYALAALIALVPPQRITHVSIKWYETVEETTERYRSIASDIASVTDSRIEVAALVGVAVHESALAADVDRGECERSGRWFPRCDGGRAVSLWQLQEGDPERKDTIRCDRAAAAREALRRIRWSWNACRALEPALRLSAYASGRCTGEGRAGAASRELYQAIARALRVKG